VGASSTHGLARTNKDKRRAVEILLRDEEWAGKSDRQIAEKAAVTQPFALKVRRELAGDNGYTLPETRTGKDGKQYPTRKAKAPANDAPADLSSVPLPRQVHQRRPLARGTHHGAMVEKVRVVVLWRYGVTFDGKLLPCGATADMQAHLAAALAETGKVRIVPQLAPRPRRRGEPVPTPEPEPERPWWLGGELDDMKPTTAAGSTGRQRRVRPGARRRPLAR